MFCPSCGAEYTIELKYCNRCGANLSANVAQQVQPVVINVTKPTLIVGALVLLVTLGGFAAVVSGAITLAQILHGNDSFMAIILFGMLTILIIDIFLVRLLSKLINAALSPNQNLPAPSNFSPALNPQFQNATTTARLQSMPSVTESTTRFFEPYRAPEQTAIPTPEKNR